MAFLILSILWYFEHQRFRVLKYLDRPLLCMNIGSLVFVCLIPFSTNLAGDYPFDVLGAIIFEVNIFIVAMIILVQWPYIRRMSQDIVPIMNADQISRQIRWSLVIPGVSLLGIILAALNIPYSLAIYLLVPLIMSFLFWKKQTV